MLHFRLVQWGAVLVEKARQLAIVLLLIGAQTSTARAQVLETSYGPSFNDTVRAIAFRPGGGTVAGGQFWMVSGWNVSALARLEVNGLVHPAPMAAPNDTVLALNVDANNAVLIGGRFDSVGGVARRAVAKISASGALDTTFVPQLDGGATVEVTHLAVQPDGKIVIAGRFASIGGVPRGGLARLNSNGSLDTSYVPPSLGGVIDAMTITAGGQIVIAGSFSAATTTCANHCVIRLQSNGARDTSFVPTETIGTIKDLSMQSDGRILVGGDISALGAHQTSCVGRLLANGGADTSFTQPELRYSRIWQVRQVTGGRVLIAGLIRWGTAGVTEDRVARLHPDGVRDTHFIEPVFNSQIMSIAAADNMIMVAGQFTTASGIARNRLARYRLPLADLIFRSGFD